MTAPLKSGLSCFLSLAMVLFCVGCVPLPAHNSVTYNRNGRWPDGLKGPPGNGSVAVRSDHGLFWLVGPEGPWRQHRSFYGVYFEEGPQAPEKFKLIVEHDGPYEQTFGVAGKVVVDGRYVLIQAKYKDSNGHWKKLPVNGRHRIDEILPDDLPRPKPGTQ